MANHRQLGSQVVGIYTLVRVFYTEEKVPSAGIEKGTTGDGWISLDGRMTHHDSLSASTLLENKKGFFEVWVTPTLVYVRVQRDHRKRNVQKGPAES